MTVLPSPFWRSVEALNNYVYLVPQAATHYRSIGLKGSWMGYFASRAAPLGAASPELVVATFHGFAPHLVHRALPDAWTYATPAQVHAARLDLATSFLGHVVTAEQAEGLADALAGIVDDLDLAGKPLAAAHASVPAPDDPVARLWLVNAVLREYRGDCHVASLITHGLGGVDANVLEVAAGRTFAQQQTLRGWSDEEWSAGRGRLTERGWLDADGALTPHGSAARDELEETTDRTVRGGLGGTTQQRIDAVTDEVRALARSLRDSLRG